MHGLGDGEVGIIFQDNSHGDAISEARNLVLINFREIIDQNRKENKHLYSYDSLLVLFDLYLIQSHSSSFIYKQLVLLALITYLILLVVPWLGLGIDGLNAIRLNDQTTRSGNDPCISVSNPNSGVSY